MPKKPRIHQKIEVGRVPDEIKELPENAYQVHLLEDAQGEPATMRPYQKEIWRDETRNKVFNWHRRSGKTMIASAKMIVSICQNFKHRYWYLGPYQKQAKSIVWEMVKIMVKKCVDYQKNFKINETELSIKYLPTDSIFEVKGADNPDSLRGAGLNGVIMDEMRDIDRSVYTLVVRPMLSLTRGWTWMISTPRGQGAFYEYFMKGVNEEEGWKSWYLRASESGILPKDELDALKSELSPDEYAQEYECDFLSYAGLVYKDFGDHNIIRPIEIPKYWEIGYGFDHGARNPTSCHKYAIDLDGNIFVVGEYYVAGKTVAEHAPPLKDLMDPMRNPIADPSCFIRNLQKGTYRYSIADQYAEYGIHLIPAQRRSDVSKSVVLAGIDRVSDFMRFRNDHKHPVTGNKGAPRLFIFNTCVNLIDEIKGYRWKERKDINQNLPEQPMKVRDHAVDDLRYFIFSRPASGELAESLPEGEFERLQVQHIRSIKESIGNPDQTKMDFGDKQDMCERVI